MSMLIPRLLPAFVAALLVPLLAGCLSFDRDQHDACWRDRTPTTQGAAVPEPTAANFAANAQTAYVDMGFDGQTWPDLEGARITVLDHGAFDYAFAAAKPLFESLTNATVVQHAADDAGTALELAVQDQQTGGGSFDILYGIDNALMSRAIASNVFEGYTPLLAERVAPEHRFIPLLGQSWAATPVDVGYIGINVDARAGPVASLDDLVPRAQEFVTQDPRFSTPGLGFLISTVATYGEDCYLGYWEDLMDNGLTVTNGWTEAYVDRFSGGYGQWESGTRGDKAIVTSYTTSPAYEMFYGAEQRNHVLVEPQATFQQIQTMGIVKGTTQRAAAEAWIEFTLTDAFQTLAAEYNAIYPAIQSAGAQASVKDVYGGNDPQPGSFVPASLTAEQVGQGVSRWVSDWVDLYDAKRA